MKVLGIDASRICKEKPTGVERYSIEIIKAIVRLNKDFELKFYTAKEIAFLAKKSQKIIKMRRFWTLIGLSLEMLRNKPDALFVPAHVLPFFAPEKSFVTIHDAAFKKVPEAYGFLQKFYLDWSTKRAIHKCELIFVPSESVKKDLIKFYGAENAKICVAAHGPLQLLKVSQENVKKILKKFGIGKKENLFFYFGRIEKKKNLETLIKAWKIAVGKFPQMKLILGGSHGFGAEKILSGIGGTILAPGYLSEEDLSALLQSSSAMILPSLDEGFGLPILQAFEAETAIICSDIPTLREVAGNAALYANPKNAKAFAENIIKVKMDKKLRFNLIEAGKERLKKFSWDRASKAVLEQIEKSL